MRKSIILTRWMTVIGFVLTAITAVGSQIGIYAPEPDGGRVVGDISIRNTLTEAGMEVEGFVRMSMENLLKYNVIIIPNTRSLAQNEEQRWRDNLRAYVVECGGAIIFIHDATGAARSPFGQFPFFPEIIIPGSVERNATTKIKVAVHPQPDEADTDFNYLPEYKYGQTVTHMYDDHFKFENSGGIVLLTDPENEKAVVAIGEVGKGRVVFNGMFGGHPSGLAARLEGIDRDVMINTVKWCLAGDGLVITDTGQIKVPEWRPAPMADSEKPKNKVAVIGSPDYDIRHRARTKISWAGLDHDFIPIHFLNVRNLDVEDYQLAIFFPPRAWQESDVTNTAFEKVSDYIKAGGKAIIFLPMSIGDKTASYFLEPIGIARDGRGLRDNPDLLCAVTWNDADGNTLTIKDVPQNSFHAITEPEADNTETIGYWFDWQGKQKSPAIIKTAFGYIVNINSYGDHRMFTANAAVELFPDIAPDIFNHLLKTYNETVNMADTRKFSGQSQKILNQAEKLRQNAETAAQNKEFATANLNILQAESELVKAYAVSMPSVKNEERIIWTWGRPSGTRMPDPNMVCARIAQAGFTGLAVTHLEGYYPSKLYTRIHGEENTDWMQKWLDAAHKHGLKFGPGFSTFNIYEGTDIYDRVIAEDWRVVPGGMYGKPAPTFRTGWRLHADICRARPEMTDYAVRKSLEIIEKYPVDYVFYDYIRWTETCYCDYCKEKLQQDTDVKIEKWPDDVMGKYQNEYNDWRAGSVTRVIRTAAANIARINPDIKMGVGTFRTKRESWSKGQYWWEWSDYVDFISPMSYGPDNQNREELFRHVNELLPADGKARLVPTLAPPGEKGGTDLERLQQLDLQRQYAPAGVVFFWYHGLTDAYLDLLRIGPFRQTGK